jgi:hypothetical protein
MLGVCAGPMPTCRLELMGIHDSSGYQRPSNITGFGVCGLIFSQWLYQSLKSITKFSLVSADISSVKSCGYLDAVMQLLCRHVQTSLRVDLQACTRFAPKGAKCWCTFWPQYPQQEARGAAHWMGCLAVDSSWLFAQDLLQGWCRLLYAFITFSFFAPSCGKLSCIRCFELDNNVWCGFLSCKP